MIPKEGDWIEDPRTGLMFYVQKMGGPRIDLVKVRFTPDMKNKPSNLDKYSFLFLFFSCLPFLGGGEGINGNSNTCFYLAPFLFLLVFSLILSAFYSGTETAVVSASRAKIEVLSKQKDKRAVIIHNFLKEPDKMLSIILVGNNLVNVVAGVAGLHLISYLFPENESLQGILNTFIMTIFILIFCEILPKTIFRVKADKFALRSAYGLWFSAFFFRPVAFFITKMTNRIVGQSEDELKRSHLRGMREELKYLAKMGAKEGVLKQEQIQMINRALELETKTVEMVMTPQVDIMAVPKNLSLIHI